MGFDQPHTILPNGFAAEVAVPAWAKFMKTATKGDAPEWLTPPTSLTTATVCRLSGKLATDGCNDVEVVNKNGDIEHRSMIYTEYFARGTEPTTYCDLHTLGFSRRIAGLFVDMKPAPVHLDETPTAVAPAATSGSTDRVETPPQPPKKKRGFWGRLFGRGDDSEKRDDPAPPPKKKGGQ